MSANANSWALRTVNHDGGIPANERANSTLHHFIAREGWFEFWCNCVDVIGAAKRGDTKVVIARLLHEGEHQISGAYWTGILYDGVEGVAPLRGLGWISVDKLSDEMVWRVEI